MNLKNFLLLIFILLLAFNQDLKSQIENSELVYADKYFFSYEFSKKSVILYARRDTTIEIWVNGVKDTSNIKKSLYGIDSFECWDTGISYWLRCAKEGPLIVRTHDRLGDGLEFQYDAPIKGMCFGNVTMYDCSTIYQDIDWEKDYWKNLKPEQILNLNNSAYYLQKIGCNDCAISLLEDIIKISPKRIVAYLNLGDAYWAKEEKNKAIENYNKYIELMKEKGWEGKIPKKVIERLSQN